MKYLKYTAVLSVLLILRCQRKTNELEFEKNTLVEIFPAAIDSLWIENRITLTPPPPIDFKEKNKDVAYWENSKKQLKEELLDFKKAHSKITAVISDTIRPINSQEQTELQLHFQNITFGKEESEDRLYYLMDRKRIAAFPNLKVIFASKNYWENRKHSHPAYLEIRGTVSLSKILFDDTKNYGLLRANVSIFGSVSTYRIFIKKSHGKWLIDKLKSI